MMQTHFQKTYSELGLPVVVCTFAEGLPIVYMNPIAGRLFAPTQSVNALIGQDTQSYLRNMILFSSDHEFEGFRSLVATGHLDDYNCEMTTFDGEAFVARIYGNQLKMDDNEVYYVFYLVQSDNAWDRFNISHILNNALITPNTDASIQMILDISGKQMDVSRTYIFEEISETTTANTYEWCAPGIQPAIQDLQELKKEDYNYDVIVNSGMYVAENVSLLPDEDREILESQGIMALAIIPIYDLGQPVGYVGFDDCDKYRAWSNKEIQFLQTIALILSMLIKRRKDEEQLTYYASTDIMTGTANREWGTRILEEKLARDTKGSLCFIDLDGLKRTNDQYGHEAGDDFIIGIIGAIKNRLQPEDFVCRWGGDEFLVWMSKDAKKTADVIAQIQSDLAETNKASGKPYEMDFSFGIVAFENAARLDSLVMTADALMYDNKIAKKGLAQRRRRTD